MTDGRGTDVGAERGGMVNGQMYAVSSGEATTSHRDDGSTCTWCSDYHNTGP